MQLKEFLSDLLLTVFRSGRQGLLIHFVRHDVLLTFASTQIMWFQGLYPAAVSPIYTWEGKNNPPFTQLDTQRRC